MKQIQARIEVETHPDGLPQRFRYRERAYNVGQVLDAWKYGGRWWLHEPPRRCYRVQAGQLLAELHAEDIPGGRWWLAAVQD